MVPANNGVGVAVGGRLRVSVSLCESGGGCHEGVVGVGGVRLVGGDEPLGEVSATLPILVTTGSADHHNTSMTDSTPTPLLARLRAARRRVGEGHPSDRFLTWHFATSVRVLPASSERYRPRGGWSRGRSSHSGRASRASSLASQAGAPVNADRLPTRSSAFFRARCRPLSGESQGQVGELGAEAAIDFRQAIDGVQGPCASRREPGLRLARRKRSLFAAYESVVYEAAPEAIPTIFHARIRTKAS